jgi:hypothetical protein
MTSTAEHFRRELNESNSWIQIAMEASGDTLATSAIRQVIQSGATIVTAGMGGSLGLAMTTSFLLP